MDVIKLDLKLKTALLEMASQLNKSNINWGLGGSLLLHLKGINTSVHDIDFVIDEKDLHKMDFLVKEYKHKEIKKNEIYLTKKTYKMSLNNIEIDLIVGFKVKTPNGVYSYPSGSDLVSELLYIDDVKINLCSLKDWLNTYRAINRTDKVNMIKKSKLVT